MARKKKPKTQGSHGENQENITPDAEPVAKKSSKRPPQNQILKDETEQPPPAKKVKKTHTQQQPNAEYAPSSLPTEANPPLKERAALEISKERTTKDIPNEVRHLTSKYDFSPMSILSSSKMEHKIRNVLERINKFSFTDVTGKPGVVILHAQAKNASKMITIAEVSKRETEKDKGNWWQYTKLEGQVLEMKMKSAKSGIEPDGKTLAMWEAEKAKGDVGADVEMGESHNDQVDDSGGVTAVQGEAEGEEEDEEMFESMTVPATDPRAADASGNGRKKVRAVPVMTIFLARVPIPGLKELYGEQTNSSAS